MTKTLPGLALAMLLAGPPAAFAQDTPQDKPQGSSQDSAPAMPAQAPDSTTKPMPVPGSPGLTVASVRAEGGHRVSKIIGATVINGSNQQIGTVDDLILSDDDKASLAIIAVGGFLGVGSKLVAEPFTALKFDAGKVVLPDASKESLNGMPSFTYAP